MLSTEELGIDKSEQVGKVTNDCQNMETLTDQILRRIDSEPNYRIVLYKILHYCDPARPMSDVEQKILSMPEMKGAFHSPQLLLSWLVGVGGIDQINSEKGERMWCTTQAGRKVVRLESCDSRLMRLLDQDRSYQDIYLKVLQACLTPKSRTEIESLLNGNILLEKPKVYPSFFIENLERAGGLEWDVKWRTTLAGKDFLNLQSNFET